MNLVEHLLELAADWNAAFLYAERDETTRHRAATEMFLEWPNGEIIEIECWLWVGGDIFQYSKFLPDKPKGKQIEPGYLSVEGARNGWVENYDFVANFKNQHFIYDMCRNSCMATKYKSLRSAISWFEAVIDDDPALLELLSND